MLVESWLKFEKMYRNGCNPTLPSLPPPTTVLRIPLIAGLPLVPRGEQRDDASTIIIATVSSLWYLSLIVFSKPQSPWLPTNQNIVYTENTTTTKKCTGYGKGRLSHVSEGGGFPLIWNLFCWRKIGREWGGQVPPLRPIPWRSLTNCQWWLLLGQNAIRQNSRWFVVILSGPFCCHLAFSSSSSLHLISSFHIPIIILILYANFLVLFCYNIIAKRLSL